MHDINYKIVQGTLKMWTNQDTMDVDFFQINYKFNVVLIKTPNNFPFQKSEKCF
jgi:hypothetical protein